MDRLDASANENDWAARVGATYLRHITSLRGLLIKRSHAPQQVVEDALHDVFCAVLRLRQCPGRSREGALTFAYLCAAGMRRVRRVMQQRTRSQRRLEQGVLREAVVGTCDESDRSARAKSVESVSAQDVECAMRGLTPRQRDVLRVSFSTVGCGRDEARMLGVTAGAHAVEKHRAIVALRRALHVECGRAVDRSSPETRRDCGACS
jgi:DNA-directed RNA polymerase specialized sigma24 family protein